MSTLAQYENPTPPGYLAPDRQNYADSEKTALRALEMVKACHASARDGRGSIVEAWHRQDEAYFNIRHRRNFHGRANVVDPEPFRVVETITARVSRALLQSKPWIRGFPGPGEVMADLKQAFINESLVQYQLETGSDGKRILTSEAKKQVIRGTTVMKVQWANESLQRRMRDPLTGKLAKPEDTFVYRGPKWSPVDLEDFYVADPLCGETPDEQDFVIETKIVRLHKLKAMERMGQLKNTGKIIPADVLTGDQREEDGRAERAALIGASYSAPDPKKAPASKAELWIYEGPFDLYDDGSEVECWIWCANGKHVLRCQENPYWHGRRSYVSAPCIRIPGNFYGISPLSPILDLWAEMNDLHNMGLDSAVLSLSPAFKVGAAAGIDFRKWLLRPGAFLPANDISQIEPLVVPPMIDVAHKAIAPIREMMRETTSATDLLQSQSTGGIDKATIYQGAIKEANVRIAVIGGELAAMLEAGANKHWALNQQYMDEETNVRITGRHGFEWIPVRPEDVKYPMDWKAVGVQNIGAEMTKGLGLERFVAVATPLSLQLGVPINWKKVLTDFYTSLGMSDAESIFEPQGPGPMDPRQENLMLSQRQPVDVHQAENFSEHYRQHLSFRQELQGMAQQTGRSPDPIALKMLEDHLEQTQAMYQKVQAAQQTQRQMQAQMLMNQVSGDGKKGGNGAQEKQPSLMAPPPVVPALGNQSRFGAGIGAAKETGERLAGRQG